MENKKKEVYETPDVELLKFEKSDIITTSGFFGAEDDFTVGNNSGGSSSNSGELPGDSGAGR